MFLSYLWNDLLKESWVGIQSSCCIGLDYCYASSTTHFCRSNQTHRQCSLHQSQRKKLDECLNLSHKFRVHSDFWYIKARRRHYLRSCHRVIWLKQYQVKHPKNWHDKNCCAGSKATRARANRAKAKFQGSTLVANHWTRQDLLLDHSGNQWWLLYAWDYYLWSLR